MIANIAKAICPIFCLLIVAFSIERILWLARASSQPFILALFAALALTSDVRQRPTNNSIVFKFNYNTPSTLCFGEKLLHTKKQI